VGRVGDYAACGLLRDWLAQEIEKWPL
jgi:hypothetical protein